LAIAMAESLKFMPCTNHIAIKYDHFCSRVNTSYNPSGDIKIKNIFLQRSNLQIFLPNQLMLASSFFFAICYVAGEVISKLLCFQESLRMQASILSLVFKLAELIFIKAHNSINH
jgi:hypothetical protein